MTINLICYLKICGHIIKKTKINIFFTGTWNLRAQLNYLLEKFYVLLFLPQNINKVYCATHLSSFLSQRRRLNSTHIPDDWRILQITKREEKCVKDFVSPLFELLHRLLKTYLRTMDFPDFKTCFFFDLIYLIQHMYLNKKKWRQNCRHCIRSSSF